MFDMFSDPYLLTIALSDRIHYSDYENIRITPFDINPFTQLLKYVFQNLFNLLRS